MSAKKMRSNKKQLTVLIDYMSSHTHLATGEFTGPIGARNAERQWQALKELLKEHGPDRTVDQWKQSWKDIKKSARKEDAAAAWARCATGNVQTAPALSSASSKVLGIIGHECSTGIGPEELIDVNSEDWVVGHEEDTQPSYTLPTPKPCRDTDNIPVTASQRTSQIRNETPEEVFARLQQENNAYLQSIDKRLRERNILLKEQNQLLREQNTYIAHKYKMKRKRFTPHFTFRF